MHLNSPGARNVTTGMIAVGLLTMSAMGISSGFTGYKEITVDYQVASDVENVAMEIEQGFALENSYEKAIEKVKNDDSLKASDAKTSISVMQNEKGYCLIGMNQDGSRANQGLYYANVNYSNSIPGITTKDESMCDEAGLAGTPELIVGEAPDYAADEDESDLQLVPLLAGGGIVLIGTFGKVQQARYDDEPAELEKVDTVKAVSPPPPALPRTRSRNNNDEWKELLRRYETVKKEWASYELDPVKILSYPALANMGIASTASFHKALRVANHLAPQTDKIKTAATGSAFESAVLELEHQFEVMLSEAKRLKWNGFSEKEQNSLRTAQNLLSIAVNSASSDNERQIAYKQLLKEIEGIIVMPAKTILELEMTVMKALEPMASS